MNRVAIVGPGAIGCLFGGLLAGSGVPVVLFHHEPEAARAISVQGISIHDGNSKKTYQVECTCDLAGLRECGTVLVCVKSFSTADVACAIAEHVQSEAAVVSIQNGGGNMEQLEDALGLDANLLCCSTSQGATVISPGCVIHAGCGISRLGEWRPGTEKSLCEVQKLFADADISAEIVDDTRRMIWRKLMVNAAINPLTALLDVSNGELLNNEEANRVIAEIASEAATVAAALGIDLGLADPAGFVRDVCTTTSSNISSMLQDIRASKGTEIEAINGYIVRAAEESCLRVPETERLLNEIHILESKGRADT